MLILVFLQIYVSALWDVEPALAQVKRQVAGEGELAIQSIALNSAVIVCV